MKRSTSLSLSEEVEVARSVGEGDVSVEVVGAEETTASVMMTVESTETRTGEGRSDGSAVLSNCRASTGRVELTVAGGRD